MLQMVHMVQKVVFCLISPVGVHDNICGRDDMESYCLWTSWLRKEQVEYTGRLYRDRKCCWVFNRVGWKLQYLP